MHVLNIIGEFWITTQYLLGERYVSLWPPHWNYSKEEGEKLIKFKLQNSGVYGDCIQVNRDILYYTGLMRV